jgi:hypothetical protein
MRPQNPRPHGPLSIVLLLALVAAIAVFTRPPPTGVSPLSGDGEAPVPATRVAAAQEKPVVSRPLAVGHSGARHEWTAEDARLPEVIEKLAHNPEEFIRMVEENDRIQRRQLVYRKEPAWHTVEQSKGRGEVIRTLKLPALDGRELEFEVTSIDLAPSGLSGTFAGHLPGEPQSLVTLAFDRGREAFTVLSPEEGLYLQGHPREAGELLVTSFDPAIYQPLQICEPIITSK